MTAEIIEAGGLSVKNSLLATAAFICRKEQRSLTEMGRFMVQWSPDDQSIFPVPLALEQVVLHDRPENGKFNIAQATFWVGGDLEIKMVVASNMKDDLNNDPFAPDILRGFWESFSAHPHTVCLRSLREKRQAEVRKQKLLAQSFGQRFTVVDRRSAAKRED